MMQSYRRIVLGPVAAVCVLLLAMASPLPAAIKTPAQPQPIMPLDEVRIGMKGYGLTVFHGTKIEPFPVEVISVMRDFAPKRGVIWIRCLDERMQKSGPVQGMSGSPIYLWDEGEEGELGKGGRLIGAFAFGYTAQVDCYAGVQPIELMRDTASRVPVEGEQPVADAQHSGLSLHDMVAVLDRMNAPPHVGWRARTLAQMLPGEPRGDLAAELSGPAQLAGQPQRLLLPLRVSSSQIALATAPLLEKVGLMPLATPRGLLVGNPPREVQPDQVMIQPGSVLSIPLGFGDADLSAAGTVTDVLPDGRVLGFGHAMFGEGGVALPMATGYVHYIVANRQTSFKLGGSLAISGAIVRDENSAVVGTPDGRFNAAPVQVRVNMHGQPPQVYNYHMVNHRGLSPMIAAMLMLESIEAVQSLPPENTVRVVGNFTFEGGRTLTVNSLSPMASQTAMLFNVVPVVNTAMDNPFEPLDVTSIDLQVDVEAIRRDARFVDARIDRREVAPGEAVHIAIDVQPHGRPVETVRIRFQVPENLPEGEYEIAVSDSSQFASRLAASRPHLSRVTNLDELFEQAQKVLAIPDDALFVSMMLPEGGVAVGRTELPQLPSSHRAILGSGLRSGVSLFREMMHQVVPVNFVPTGQVTFTIQVKENNI